ncbi:MAG: NAD-dependent epimerase/dehydratase family protein [Anaerolineae bacterium]
MRILIIGGTGLISTAITRQLLARGDDVTLYNRGRRETSLPKGALLLRGDRSDHAAFEHRMQTAGPFDCVIDMICYAPEEAESDIRAFAGRVGHFIFCSTVDVYAKPASCYPYHEGEPQRPVSRYGADKSRCEALFLQAQERGDLPVTILRPAHTYGEGGGLVHSLGWRTYVIDRIRRGLPIIVHGDGQSLWSSCHIDDVATAFVAAAGNSRALGRAYHVTGEQWLTWNQYHQGIAAALSAPEPRLVHIPSHLLARLAPEARVCVENLQFDNIFDNSAARADLGFSQTVRWREGVRRTVAWLDEHIQVEPAEACPEYDRVLERWQACERALMGEGDASRLDG